MADKHRFEAAIQNILVPAYKAHRFSLSNDEIDSWFERFNTIPDLAVVHAIQDWIDSQNFPPTIADLRRMAGARLKSRPGDYGLEKQWKEPHEKVRGRLLPMPEHVRARIEQLKAEAAQQVMPEQMQVRRDAMGNPIIDPRKKQATEEQREHRRQRILQDYTRRYFKVDENGKLKRKPPTIMSQSEMYVGDKKCRVLKMEDGSVVVQGLETLDD
jgi:hypothetical protein